MKAAIYCRVSTEAQEREGSSLDTQLEACQTKARELGYDVEPKFTFSETYTGADLQRPQLTQARETVRNGEVNALICYDTSRLARKAVHIAIIAEECEKSKAELIFVTEPLDSSPEGQLIRYVKGYAAEIEREKIAERTYRGRMARALSGKLPSGSHAKLYGYIYIKGKEDGQGVRLINEEEARWVREVFGWLVDEGLSTQAIAYRLRDLNVPTPSGKGWWRGNTVAKILKNSSYIGKCYANTQTYVTPERRVNEETKHRKTHLVWKPISEWILIENASPPIISEDLFQKVQQRLKENSRMATRNGKNHYLLRSHVVCGRCQRSYWASPGIDWRKGERYEYPYYHCSGGLRRVTPIRCDNPRHSARRLENIVWAEIERQLYNPDLILSTLERMREEHNTSSLQRDLEIVQNQLRNREKQKERLWNAYKITGDEAEFRREITKLDNEVERLNERRADYEALLSEARDNEVGEQEYRDACKALTDNLAELDYEKKRLILRVLQIKVVIDGHNIQLYGTLPTVACTATTLSRYK